MVSYERTRKETPESGEGHEVLEEKIRALETENALLEWHIEYLEEQRGIDTLTGAKNLGFFKNELEQVLKFVSGEVKEKRIGAESLEKVVLVYVDLDHFKNINDTLGHPTGDMVLQKVSAALIDSVRRSDVVARIGGEEFAILMRNTEIEEAREHMEKLRAEIEQMTFDEYPDLKVTASFGITSSDTTDNAETLRAVADKALYAAKHGGRNQVVVQEGE
ncbi:MAG: GGDEF domain-containing protein [Candidatus Pacebacteria bacterium]|nr:GGDEF domain-containing protein [Candidatus Paceibacterota bacterium]